MSGFSLLEVLVASGLLAAALIGLGQLFTISTASNLLSRNATYAAVLADQKIEELRGLTWGFDKQGMPVSDLSSDTAVTPETATGGSGLSSSPSGALQQNTPGYVDYVDIFGGKIRGGSRAPRNAIYTRRWSIEPLPAYPDTLVIQVLVSRSAGGSDGARGAARRAPDEAKLVTLKTRKSR